jgi:hypothetical protein
MHRLELKRLQDQQVQRPLRQLQSLLAHHKHLPYHFDNSSLTERAVEVQGEEMVEERGGLCLLDLRAAVPRPL